MKANARWMVALAVIAGACWNGAVSSRAADNDDVAEATVMMSSYEDQQKAASAARAKDPLWKPACTEIGLIQVGDSKKPGALKNFCLNAEGNILACYAPQDKKDTAGIRVYSPKGALLNTFPLEIKPAAICVAKDGSIFVAGDGKVVKLDAKGKVLAAAPSPVASEPVVITKETEEMVKQMAKDMNRSYDDELVKMKANLEKRRADVTGLAVTDQDVFMAVGAPSVSPIASIVWITRWRIPRWSSRNCAAVVDRWTSSRTLAICGFHTTPGIPSKPGIVMGNNSPNSAKPAR